MFAEELLPELLTDGSGHLGSVRWMDAHDVAGDAATGDGDAKSGNPGEALVLPLAAWTVPKMFKPVY